MNDKQVKQPTSRFDAFGCIDADYPTGTWDDFVTMFIGELVPRLVQEFRSIPNAELEALGREAITVTTSSAESFLFHNGKPEKITAGGNAFCVQLACLAILSPSGVDFRGMHFCEPSVCDKCLPPTYSALLRALEGAP